MPARKSVNGFEVYAEIAEAVWFSAGKEREGM